MSHSMDVQTPRLPLEVLRKVISHVRSGETDCGRLVNTATRADQADLFNLLTVSKALAEVAVLPWLYNDCLIYTTSDLTAIIARDPSPFNHTRHLRVTEFECPYFPVYRSLLSGENDWSILDTRRSPDELDAVSWQIESRQHQQEGLERLCQSLVDETEQKHELLPLLEQVAMSSSKTLNGQRLRHALRYDDVDWRMITHQSLSLALFFLDHPPVKHFCQSNLLGPLGLPCGYVEVSNRPDVVTHHMSPEHLTEFLQDPPAIVLGTVNRYYFPNSTLSLSRPGDDRYPLEHEDALPLFEPLLNLFARSRPRVVSGQGSSYKVQGGGQKKDWLKGTTVEVYSFIRCYTLSKSEETRYMMGMWDPILAATNAKPGSLQRMQRALELLLAPDWRGHVILKHREDAPPCTACGLDLNEQYWKTVKGQWYVPS